MNLGELFIKLGVKGDTKKLDEANKQLEKAEKSSGKVTKSLKNQNQAWLGAVKGIGAFVTGATLAYKVVDRMVTSLAQANQQLINIQRTTGLSFASLNKYASANAAVNFNSSIEGTAQSMQRVANNLWDIQMGRGDISPYQELAFVGGKAFNPYGMSVEQVIESVRDAIKGVDDLQATNIITRMGFAPEDLMMLRMSREEFEKINDLFLSPQQREEMYKYGLELKKINLSLQKIGQSLIIDLAKPFIKIATIIERLANLVYKGIIKPIQLGFKVINSAISNTINLVKSLTKAFIDTFNILKPIFSIIKMIGEIIWLPIEDVLTYLSGGDSLTGRALEGLSNIIDNLSNSFENSKIVKFFESIKQGIIDLTTLKIPKWLQGFFGMIGENALQMSQGMQFNPAPINTNKLSHNANNIETNNQFTINTNQPTDMVAANLINTFTPTQVQYSTLAV